MHSEKQLTQFKKVIWDYYATHKREFPWRNIENPYYIIVSEIMLQQTQTHRVIAKYEQFIAQFPTIHVLAQAQQANVIKAWQGLGYNRRALSLHKTAQKIVQEHKSIIPNCPTILQTFPGIGKATASSIAAFAYNKPTTFIETNIRAVFIYCFFANQSNITDEQLIPLVAATIDPINPREWYYALMDYGVMLKKNCINPSRLSKHHTKQSAFEGSDRQIRGMILKLLSQETVLNFEQFCDLIPREQQRIKCALDNLLKEGFIKNIQTTFTLA